MFTRRIKMVGKKLGNATLRSVKLSLGSDGETVFASDANSSIPPMSEFRRKYNTNDMQALGKGAFGVVKSARRRKDGKSVAVKAIDKSKIDGRHNKYIYREPMVLKDVDHPNVVKYHEMYEDQEVVYLVMEHIPGESLEKNMNNRILDEDDAKQVILGLVLGLQYCKLKGIIHRDIKPANIVLRKKNDFSSVVLVDFGLARTVDPQDFPETSLGTHYYVAPEVASPNKKYNYKCDVWSVGVLLFYLLSGTTPLEFFEEQNGSELSPEEQLKFAMNGEWDFEPADRWATVSQEAKDFISMCMCKNPKNRATYNMMLRHTWLNTLEDDLQEEQVKEKKIVPEVLDLCGSHHSPESKSEEVFAGGDTLGEKSFDL